MIYLLIFIAGLSKAVMDTLQFHFNNSIFQNTYYWNPKSSWMNKYVWDSKGENIGRKKLLGIPIPVLFTDGWHLFQSIYMTSIFIAITLYVPIFTVTPFHTLLDFILLRSVFGFSFILFYDELLIKHNGK